MKYLLTIIIFGIIFEIQAQTTIIGKNELREKIISMLNNNESEETGYEELIEKLTFYYYNPLNINDADEEDLKQIFFLNENQIYNLLVYRYTYGPLLSVYELKAIPLLDKKTIENLLPFITIDNPKRYDTIKKKLSIKNELLIRYQRKFSVKNNIDSENFLGSLNQYYFKYKLIIGKKLTFGFVIDHDAGEPLFNKYNPSGFDFYSGYLQFSKLGILQKLIIGDFNIEIGQGLTIWSSIAFGKSSDAVGVKKNAKIIIPKSSGKEYGFFRGIASLIQIQKIDIAPFISFKYNDANIIEYSNDKPYAFSSFSQTGYHRTLSELNKKNSVSEMLAGLRIAYNNKKLNIGFTACYTKLGANMSTMPAIYNLYSFKGRENINAGIDFSYLFMNHSFWGEISYSKNGALSSIFGFNFNPHSIISFCVLARYYDKKYQNLHSNSFGYSDKGNNEIGVYSGLKFNFWDRLYLNAYYDLYKTQWIRYNKYSLGISQEFMTCLSYELTSLFFMRLKYVFKNRPENIKPIENNIITTSDIKKHTLSFDADYVVSKQLELENSITYINTQGSNKIKQQGFAINSSVSYTCIKIPLKVHFAYIFFDTDTYDERVYIYENDLLYNNSFNVLYGTGSKYYFLVSYRLLNKITLWIKFSQLFNFKAPSITGISSQSSLSEIKFQIRIKL